MNLSNDVAVFWDYENCPVPSNASGCTIANAITSFSRPFGSIRLFRAYLEIPDQLPLSRSVGLRSELQSSGVSLIDCPHNGRKEVADKMILVDMLTFAIDNPTPCTIVIISGDKDFAYALSALKIRQYRMVLVTLSNAHTTLTAQASVCFDWNATILNPSPDLEASHSNTVPMTRPPGPLGAHELVDRRYTHVCDQCGTNLPQNIHGRTGHRQSFSQPTLNGRSGSKAGLDQRLGDSGTDTKNPSRLNTPYVHRRQDSSSRAPHHRQPSQNKPERDPVLALPQPNGPPRHDSGPYMHSHIPSQVLSEALLSNSGDSEGTATDSSAQTAAWVESQQLEPSPLISPTLTPTAPVWLNGAQWQVHSDADRSGEDEEALQEVGTMALPAIVQPPLETPCSQGTPDASPQVDSVDPSPTSVPSDPSGSTVSTTETSTPLEPSPSHPQLPISDTTLVSTPPPPPILTSNSQNSLSEAPTAKPRPVLTAGLPAFSLSAMARLQGLVVSADEDESPRPDPPSPSNETLVDKQSTSQAQEDTTSVSGVTSLSSSSVLYETAPTTPHQLPQMLPPSSVPHSAAPTRGLGINGPSNRRTVPLLFTPIVQTLQTYRTRGQLRPLLREVAIQSAKAWEQASGNIGMVGFGQSVNLAVKAGIVEMGGYESAPWVSLRPDWHDAVPEMNTLPVSESASERSSDNKEASVPGFQQDGPNTSSGRLVKAVDETSSVALTMPPNLQASSTSTSTTLVPNGKDSSTPVLMEDVNDEKTQTPNSPTQNLVTSPVTQDRQLSIDGSPSVVGKPAECLSTNSSPQPDIPVILLSSLHSTATQLDSAINLNVNIKSSASHPPSVRIIPPHFEILVTTLQDLLKEGVLWPPLAKVSLLVSKNEESDTLQLAGVETFEQYIQLAQKEEIIVAGGKGGDPPWIGLRRPWYNAVTIRSLQLDTQITAEECISTQIPLPNPQPTPAGDEPQANRLSDLKSRSVAGSNASTSIKSTSPAPTIPQLPTATTKVSYAAVATSALESSSLSGPPNLFHFIALVQNLREHKAKGQLRPRRSVVARQIGMNGEAYRKAGVQTFAQYADMAVKLGIIEVGGQEPDAWISLHPNWHSSMPSIKNEIPPIRPVIPPEFLVLVQILQALRLEGVWGPLWSHVSTDITSNDAYKRAEYKQFKDYIEAAAKRGIVETGGEARQKWMRLLPDWYF